MTCKIEKVKGRVTFALDLSLEISEDSYSFFLADLLLSLSYFFYLFFIIHPLLLSAVLDGALSITDMVLSVNFYANLFVFGKFNIHHKDWLTYSSRIDKSNLGQTFSNNPLGLSTIQHGS